MVTIPIGMSTENFETLMKIKDICLDVDKRSRKSVELLNKVQEIEAKIKQSEALEQVIQEKKRYEIEREQLGELGKKAIVGLFFSMKASYKDSNAAIDSFFNMVTDCKQGDETSMANAMKKAIETLAGQPASFGPEKQQVNYAYLQAFIQGDAVFMKFYKSIINAHPKVIPVGRSPFKEDELREQNNPVNVDGRIIFIRALLIDFYNQVQELNKSFLKKLADPMQVKSYQDIYDTTWKNIVESNVFKTGQDECERHDKKMKADLETLEKTMKENREAFENGKKSIEELHQKIARQYKKTEDIVKEIYEIYDKSNVPHIGKEAANSMTLVLKKMNLLHKGFFLEAS